MGKSSFHIYKTNIFIKPSEPVSVVLG